MHDHQPPTDERELEGLIHRELRRLPELEAPGTLIPRVMATIAARAQLPWWRRAWLTWPSAMQVLSVLLLLAAVGVAASWGLRTWEFCTGHPLLQKTLQSLASFSFLWQVPLVLLNALGVVVRSHSQQLMIYGGGLLAVMYLSCVGLGTACYRVVFNKR